LNTVALYLRKGVCALLPGSFWLKRRVEGAKTSILAGAAGLIRQFKPIIQVEVTIDPVASLDEYVRCTYPGSPNCVLLPQGTGSLKCAVGWATNGNRWA